MKFALYLLVAGAIGCGVMAYAETPVAEAKEVAAKSAVAVRR